MKDYKRGDWNGAAYDAHAYLKLTGYKSAKMYYIYAHASYLEFLEYTDRYLDATWEWRHGETIKVLEGYLAKKPKDKRVQQYLAELQSMHAEDYESAPRRGSRSGVRRPHAA